MKKQIGLAVALLLAAATTYAQQPTPPRPPAQTDDAGPQTDNGNIILPKKKDEPAPPPAPADEKVRNPNGQVFSMRVDVPRVNLDVSVLLDSTHDFVPGLKPQNFLVVEDGVEQQIESVHLAKTPITAVLLLEFAANSYAFIRDMQNASASFFRSLQPDDYIAIETYDTRPHILTDFTNNRETVQQALESLTIPLFRESNEFDAIYETLDRLSRIEGRKYIILISSGHDSMSRINLDQMYAKIKATPNVTIYTISTGNFARIMSDTGSLNSGMRETGYLQGDNEMNTFAQMTGGKHYKPTFQGEMPDIFSQINESIRNQYVLTYKPTNTAADGAYRKVKVYLVGNEGLPLRMADEKGRPLKYSVITRDGYKAKLPVE
jgi:VWFA-related protein